MSWFWIAVIVGGVVVLIAILVVLAVLLESHEAHIPGDLPPAEADVRWAYRYVLGREPEDRSAVRDWAKKGLTREQLIERFSETKEFRRKPESEQMRLVRQAHDNITAPNFRMPPPEARRP